MHTFVGYFIGSPGMNFLPCTIDQSMPVFHNNILNTSNPIDSDLSGKLEVGVRPEFVEFADEGIPVVIEKVEDLGRYQVVTVLHESEVIKLIVKEGQTIPSESPRIQFKPEQTRVYCDGWLVEGANHE
jgi:glycerol transport system ATP-binding protein